MSKTDDEKISHVNENTADKTNEVIEKLIKNARSGDIESIKRIKEILN